MHSPPQRFHDQADQRIRSRVGNENEVDAERIGTNQRNRARDTEECAHWVGRTQSWRRRGEGIKRPEARDQKARNRPNANSPFHDAAPAVV